jgi:agmatinase
VLALQRRLPGDDPAASLATVMDLLDANVIQPFTFSAAGGGDSGRGAGMFGCPSSCVEDALSGDSCDVVFLGVPYELGVTGGKGTKSGPAYVRRSSRVAFDYVENAGIPTGWWNVADRSWVLDGVRFCDIGDVPCEGAERNGEPFDMLYDLQLSLLRAGRFPVAVGGDHSVSLPLITGAAILHPGLRVIQFDAHSDMGSHEDGGDWRKNCTHGNFMSWVAGNPNVAGILQIGIRNLLSEPPFQSPKVTTFPRDSFLKDAEAIVAQLPDAPYYLSFDVDCLDPMVISQTGTPVPGGFDYREASRALELVCRRLRIVGIDFVELIEPDNDRDFREGSAIAHLLFQALANIFEGRRANGQSVA